MSAATGKPVPPMLATLGHPPTGERWAFESKWDGVRAIATTGAKPPALWSRNGNNFSTSFPEIVDALSDVLDHRETVLDGEIVALGPDGVPSFSRLQRRMHVLKPTAQLRNDALTTYYVFDVLDIDGTSTTDLPYLERREALANLSLEHPRIKVPPHWLNVDGPTMLEVARKHHLEGIVAKSITSTYQPGKRSPSWLKTPLRANTEGIICGFVPGSGNAAGGIGSLILGAHDNSGSLVYIGNVGTGFSARQRRELREQLIDIERPTSPFAIAPPRAIAREARWSEPLLVCDVEYREYTGGGLRHPAFKGMRIDKTADDVDLPGRH
ncbi:MULTISPECIES: non-homologous end-joining DNA ligase [Rhodococcus]|uniref:non-homologous end-joining DNA ligase n=1 Tax=Rhodococcus TaxID=1827 RepID=UPI0008060FA8|nr:MULTISPECIES: non-homologous end-joining DNA ligase [Rhodococcus]ANQ76136.1 ATP-dependent DNA ligase [Rhodococcus sp. 008]